MAFIDWNEEFDMGVETINDQHKKLIGCINELYDAMKVGQGSSVLGDILKEIADYTVYHFSAEEALMEQHGYPELEGHRKEHKVLADKVTDILDRHRKNQILLSVKTLELLKTWVSEHILKTDKGYAPFFAAKGMH